MRQNQRLGFTLIELLTVMAISAVLLTVIVVPVYQTFNFTRSAQAFSDAQERARIVSDRISREIGNAVSVRNTSGLVASNLNGQAANIPQNSLVIQVPKIGSQTNINAGLIDVVLPYVKLDIVKAAEGDVSVINGVYTNPSNGFTDPTMTAPRGQPVLPAGPGATMVRYFVALHNPFATYNNPYDGLLMSRNGNRDNLFVLYRAEIQPFIYRAGIGSNGDTSMRYRPNLSYFRSDAVTDLQAIDIDDPRFFLNDGADAGKTLRIQNWQAKAVIQTEVSRYDMIQPVYDKASRLVTYAGDAPRLVPLIQFRPNHMSNDAAQGQVAVRLGEETNNAAAISPDVYKTQYGLWSNQVARVWPQGWSPTGNGFNQYFVGRNDPSNGSAGAPPGYSIYYYDPAVSTTDFNSGTEVFDIYTYELLTATGGKYPFSQAVTASNTRSSWLGNQVIKDRFTPFDMNTAKGKLITSFDITEVGDPTQTPPAADPLNLPYAMTSPLGYGPYSPSNDPNLTGNFYDPAFSTVNERFNKVWNDNPNLQFQVDRFIDLRILTAPDGSISPLNPINGFAKSRITPGSEVVYAPDENPGPNQGNTVRYVRVTSNPGPNQYTINYVDQAEPTNSSGAIDYSLLGLTPAQIGTFNPTVYSPTNLVSAVIQPRYKKGYIKFDSDPSVPMPIGQIQVDYRFQFNGTQTSNVAASVNASDVFAVDYDTRQQISVLLTIHNYPQTTNIPNPQSVTVKATATVRNVIR
jgi:prepilin-type N-terminal cleavage/methylation domain-containing protein